MHDLRDYATYAAIYIVQANKNRNNNNIVSYYVLTYNVNTSVRSSFYVKNLILSLK